MNELLTMLDTKYKRLEYLQSSGTQYIDTGINPKNYDNFRVVGQILPNTSNTNFFGANYGYWFGTTSNKYTIGGGISSTTTIGNSFDTFESDVTKTGKTSFHIEFTIDNEILQRDYDAGNNFQYISNYYLMKISQYAGTFVGKIKPIQIYGNGTLVRNFIPVLRKSDNEIGMLDLVEGKFYTNAGTGKFTANLDTMYALIQGTLTVQDGRVSGFSDSNYLKINREFSNLNSFEIVCKFNLSTLSRTNTIFSSSAYQFVLRISSNNKITFLASSSTTWDIADASGTTVLSANINYWVKVVFTGTQYIVYLSLDGKNYSAEITIDSQLKIQTMPYIIIGRRGNTGSQQFEGTIDLNRSYIKIDDTKYKLQAVVGYSQPSGSSVTITNGIASGFSSANYLTLPSIATDSYNRIEIITKITTGATLDNSLIIGNANYYAYGLCISSSKLTCRAYFGTYVSATSSVEIQANTTYDVKCTIDLNNNSISINVNGIINTNTFTNTIGTPSINYRLGYGNVGIFAGSIDLNNTYIKLNNKVWFNGLEQ